MEKWETSQNYKRRVCPERGLTKGELGVVKNGASRLKGESAAGVPKNEEGTEGGEGDSTISA